MTTAADANYGITYTIATLSDLRAIEHASRSNNIAYEGRSWFVTLSNNNCRLHIDLLNTWTRKTSSQNGTLSRGPEWFVLHPDDVDVMLEVMATALNMSKSFYVPASESEKGERANRIVKELLQTCFSLPENSLPKLRNDEEDARTLVSEIPKKGTMSEDWVISRTSLALGDPDASEIADRAPSKSVLAYLRNDRYEQSAPLFNADNEENVCPCTVISITMRWPSNYPMTGVHTKYNPQLGELGIIRSRVSGE